MERDGVKVDREVLKSAVGRVQRPDRRARGEDLRRGRVQVHHRQPAAAGRHPVRPDGPEGRAQGQVGHLVDRRQRARAAVARRRADRPAGARLAPADQAQVAPIPTRCRSRSTARPAGSTPATACRARRPGGSPRPTPTSEHPDPHRDRPAHPRRLRRRARPCHARPPTTARSSCASPPIWPTCRSCKRGVRARATTSTT